VRIKYAVGAPLAGKVASGVRVVMTDRNDFEIRRANVDDARLLTELGARLFEQAFGDVNEPENLRAFLDAAFSADAQAAEVRDPERVTFIAERDGEAIGYATLRRGRRADGVVGERPVELQRIYVDKSWHGRGVGDALMTRSIEQAQAWGCDVLWLGVWQENPRAIAFYSRTGFSKVGEQTFMVGRDPQRDFVMGRRMS
jgi:GNAT superfamily N-acetyltransferase